jgi:hypothetical protein
MMDTSRFRLSEYDGFIFVDYCNDAAVQNFSDVAFVYFNYEGTYIVGCESIRVDEL